MVCLVAIFVEHSATYCADVSLAKRHRSVRWSDKFICQHSSRICLKRWPNKNRKNISKNLVRTFIWKRIYFNLWLEWNCFYYLSWLGCSGCIEWIDLIHPNSRHLKKIMDLIYQHQFPLSLSFSLFTVTRHCHHSHHHHHHHHQHQRHHQPSLKQNPDS